MTSPLIVLQRAVRLHENLAAADIPHALGGALALAYHVQDPRGTNDIDLNVTLDANAPHPLFDALPPDLPWSNLDVEAVRLTGQVRLYWPHPDGPPTQPTPVDLFFPQDDYHVVVAGRVTHVELLDTTVPIISATDLTIFKALFSRSKDWADIEELLRYGRVDVAEVESWLLHFVGADDPRLARLAALIELTSTPREDISTAELFRKPHLGD